MDRREIIAVGVRPPGVECGVSVILAHSVDIDVFVDQTYTITGNGDDSFHKVLVRVYGITENDNVLAAYGSVRHEPVPKVRMAVMRFIDEQVIAYQQSLLHRFRWYLESL